MLDIHHLISLKKDYKSSKEPLSSKRLEIQMKEGLSNPKILQRVALSYAKIIHSLFFYISNPIMG